MDIKISCNFSFYFKYCFFLILIFYAVASMKKYFSLLIFLFLSGTFYSQNNFQDFINRVNSVGNPTEKATIIDSFITFAKTKGIPFIEGDTANFIYRGNVSTVDVAGDFNGWNPKDRFTNLVATDFYYFSKTFEQNARLDYKFVLNGSNWILDPENPHQVSGGFGPNSELAMPGYVQPWEIKFNGNIAHGTVENRSAYSINTSSTFQLKIYLPPGYNSSSSNTYPTVYFQDGFEYITLGSAVNVIDNLLDSNKIRPLIAVFVKPNNRNDEYAGSKRFQYQSFFVNELVPLVDSLYKTKKTPDQRLILGDSFGGNISALISYNHSDVFGNCGLHSGAFWPNGNEVYNLIVNGGKKDIKYSSIWGTYESLYQNMRNFRDNLITKGYKFYWAEFPEGHSWGLWRANIDKILINIFPAITTDIKNIKTGKPEGYLLKQNYPNPFNPQTKIIFSIPENNFVTLKIFDVLGRNISTLINEGKSAGSYQINFSAGGLASGIYIYKLWAGNFVESKKMILLR